MAAKGARPGYATEQAEDVARHDIEPRAAFKFALDIGDKGLGRRLRRCKGRSLAEQHRIDRQQTPRVLIGGTSHHHAIEAPQVLQRLIDVRDAAIEHDAKTGMRGFEPVDASVIEWRDVAILARRETVEPGLARVHDQRGDAGLLDRTDERLECLLRILIVDADTALDRDRQLYRAGHGGDAVANEGGLRHQTGAEAAHLHTIRGTTDIEVDLVIAERFGGARALGKLPRIAAAELKRN